jgi:exo-beta-1,3-glucanase (GH17 family)
MLPTEDETMRKRMLTCLAMLVGLVLACTNDRSAAVADRGAGAPGNAQAERAGSRRPLELSSGDDWIGNGVSYGPYRDGQRPGGPLPTRAQIEEDLDIIARHWQLLRLYGALGPSEAVLQSIRKRGSDIKVMLGAWIASEASYADDGTVLQEYPEAAAANRAEVAGAIRLANAYPDVVIALNVGNETQVAWSAHKVRADVLIDYIRQVRAATSVPVTTADDFSYWNTPESRVVARELDFIVMHAYAMWWGQPLEKAVDFTRQKYAEVAALHPQHQVVLGEAGWATCKHSAGEQARLIAGVAGESEQARFHEDLLRWTTSARVPNFYFEAFDENWKGGSHPDELEKHWGLYRADRTPKQALRGG